MADDVRPLDALQADPQNRRTHPERNLEMVRASLQQVGAARSIVIDEDDVILAGNGVTQAARDAGIASVRIVEASGDELIAVRRRGLTAEQKRALAMYDNRTAELAAWDFGQLAADREAGLDLRPYWSEAEEAMLLGEGVKPEWTGMPSFAQEDQLGFRTLKVHFKDQAAVDAFAQLVAQTITDKTKYLWYPAEAPESPDVEYAGADEEPPAA